MAWHVTVWQRFYISMLPNRWENHVSSFFLNSNWEFILKTCYKHLKLYIIAISNCFKKSTPFLKMLSPPKPRFLKIRCPLVTALLIFWFSVQSKITFSWKTHSSQRVFIPPPSQWYSSKLNPGAQGEHLTSQL